MNENGVMASNKRKDCQRKEENDIFLMPKKSKIGSLLQVS